MENSFVDISKKMNQEAIERFNTWNKQKQELHLKKQRINRDKKGNIGFGIKTWSMWWFYSGQNIGDEHGAHIDDDGKMGLMRPCIVISQPKQLKETSNNKVIIIPLTSKKETQVIRPFYVELKAKMYPQSDKFKGLEKDSYAICNEFRTIDIKRFISKITEKMLDEDIKKIKEKLNEYIDISNS